MNKRDRAHLTLCLNAVIYDLENLWDWAVGPGYETDDNKEQKRREAVE